MAKFVVEAYYNGKLVMYLPYVEAEKHGDAVEVGNQKMNELRPRMKNYGLNVKKLSN